MLWNLNGSILYTSTCPLILSYSWIIFFYVIYDTAKLLSIAGSSWSWPYGSWIYHYLQLCLPPLILWVRTLRGVFDKTCDKVCQLLTTDRCFSPGTPVVSTNKTDHHDISEILLKVALKNTVALATEIFQKTGQ